MILKLSTYALANSFPCPWRIIWIMHDHCILALIVCRLDLVDLNFSRTFQSVKGQIV